MKLTELSKRLTNSPYLALAIVVALAAFTMVMDQTSTTDQPFSPSHRYNVPTHVLATTVQAMQPSAEDTALLLAHFRGDTP